jgi:hypothetical protein
LYSHAQQYPVQGSFVLLSPYSAQLSDYANPNMEKLILNLTLTDLGFANKKIRLKLSIYKQNSLIAQSSDFISGEPNILLSGGMPQRFTSIDLAPFFRVENLIGMNPEIYVQPLPEGVYTIAFQAFDYFTGNPLSLPIKQMFWLMLNDPPLLNMPRNREVLPELSPFGTGGNSIIFQWTPRSTQVSNTEYEFTLVEIWDDQGDPYQQFLASIPKYQTTITNNTTLLYGLFEPPLQPGKLYAWRVRAKAKSGFEDIGLYRQNGYSEIFLFRYGGACSALQNLKAEAKSATRLFVTWEAPNAFTTTGIPANPVYRIAYRKYTQSKNWEWMEEKTSEPFFNILQLEAGTEYEIKLGVDCDNTFPGGKSQPGVVYTAPIVAKTLEDGVIPGVNCGELPPPIDLSNRTPIEKLNAYDVVMSNEFPMTLIKVSGNSSGWSGEAWTRIPWLGNAKIKFVFNGIIVNTDYRQISGYFETTWNPNPNKNMMMDADTLIREIGEGIKGEKIESKI